MEGSDGLEVSIGENRAKCNSPVRNNEGGTMKAKVAFLGPVGTFGHEAAKIWLPNGSY